jgi:hypothetical protein
MRHARLLMGLLLLATVLVDLAASSLVVSYCRSPKGWPNPLLLVVFSLAMSQVSMVAIWAGFGGKSIPWRMLGLVLTTLAWSRLIAVVQFAGPLAQVTTMTPGEITTDWTIVLSAQSILILVCLSIARSVGVTLPVAGEPDPARPSAGRSSLQFSLGYLLSWTTVVAVVLGLIQATVDYEFLRKFPAFVWHDYAILGLTNAGVALAAFWTALGTRRPGLRILVLVLTTTVAIFAYKLLVTHVRFPAVPVVICLLQALWLVASLWVFRVAGYRVVRQGSAAP